MAKSKELPAPEFAEFDPVALDALIGDTKTPEQLSALFRFMQKRLAERILAGELTAHLGYKPGDDKPAGQSNHRNGTTPKTVLTRVGRSRWTSRGTGRAAFGPSSCRLGCGACPSSTRPCSRSMPAACRCARSKPTWSSSTRSRSRPA